MPTVKEYRQALITGLWFMFLTFPILAIKVNPLEKTVVWRWPNMLWVGGVSACVYLLSRIFLARRAARQERVRLGLETESKGLNLAVFRQPKICLPLLGLVALFFLAFNYFGAHHGR